MWAETGSQSREARHLPEIGEQLLDLALQLVEIPLVCHLRQAYPRRSLLGMARIRRLVKLAAAAFALLLYVWYAAVRHAPQVKRQKRTRR